MELASIKKQNDLSMTSLYAKYAKERSQLSTLESDYFFVTFALFSTHVYIEDMYIVPEKRDQGYCSKLCYEIEQMGKQMGATKTLITVSPIAKNASDVMQKFIKMNFKIYKSTDDLIYLSREIK